MRMGYTMAIAGMAAATTVSAGEPQPVIENVAGAALARIVPAPFTEVRFRDAFWAPRLETNRAVTVRYDFAKCEETGRLDNFAKAAGRMEGPFRGIPFDDSDVFKVIEGAAYTLATHPDADLDAYLDRLIDSIAAAQEEDGYLYTARRLFAPDAMPAMSGKERWSNLGSSHELYNVGHLYEAAVAHFQATGKRTLLDVALRNADLVCRLFGPAPNQLREPPGHEEIEIGLCKLYRVSGRRQYLDTARFFLDLRGRPETHRLRGPGQQDHLPVTQQQEAVGHAVRAGYLYAGMADVAALTGERAFVDAVGKIWEDVVRHKLYLTGGIGARHGGEAFGDAYELPNATAYNETCAAIANALWNHRMFLLHGDSRFLDVLERVLYNGFLSGISLSGDRFFYPNPLESDGRRRFNHGSAERQPWFGCSCCPVNIVRFLPSIPGFVYATRDDGLYVNLYAAGAADVQLGPHRVRITQETDYPWDGRVRLILEPDAAAEFRLLPRVPGWSLSNPVPSDLYRFAGPQAPSLAVAVNGEVLRPAPELRDGFLVLSRRWQPGDTVEIEFPMPVRRVLAHPAVADCAGCVALQRGPIVYCVEGVDHGGHVLNLALPDDAELTVEERPDLLGGIRVLRGTAIAVREGDDGDRLTETIPLAAVPYHAWNHRGAGEMRVWLPRKPEDASPLPRPTLASASTPHASHVWRLDSLEALNDRLEPANSGDHGIPRFTWWDHRGTREWVEYRLPGLTTLSWSEVYWFDDTGRGQCRVPQSWRILALHGQDWQPVESKGTYGTAKDTFNRVDFQTLQTEAIRLEVDLQPGVSGGILEWKIGR